MEIYQRAGFQKIKGGQNRKGDNTHAMWQFWIFEKRRSQSHAYEIGRQYRFAARDGGEPAERQQHERNELGLGFAYAVADLAEKPRRELRQQRKDNCRGSSKEREPQVKMSKHDAEREHGAEIVHKTGGENNLAELSLVEAGFDHHGLDDCDRGRRQ